MRKESRSCIEDATSLAEPAELKGVSPGELSAAMPGRPVVVEVYLLRCRADGMLAYRCVESPLRASESPDTAAERIGGTATADPGLAVVVHSTSWRHRADGTIVLTYVVAPDPAPGLAATPIVSFEIARGTDPRHPSPPRVRREQVAAHAARHLALIADTDPHVSRALSACSPLRRALSVLPQLPAGQLPETEPAVLCATGPDLSGVWPAGCTR
jgi:hypothetical protein